MPDLPRTRPPSQGHCRASPGRRRRRPARYCCIAPGPDYLAAFFGCVYAGVVAVPAHLPRLSRPPVRLQAILNDCRADFALTTRKVQTDLTRRYPQIAELTRLRWVASDEAGDADAWRAPKTDADDLVFLQYTSGSTQTPKGVMVSHGNLLHNSEVMRRMFRHGPESRGVIWLPPFHDMGLIGGLLQPLYAGFPVVLMTPGAFIQRPRRWLEAVSRYRATTSGGPNFAFELCVERVPPDQLDGLDLSSWRVAVAGSEPIRAETLERFSQAFAPAGFRREAFFPSYGLAEATLLVSGGHFAGAVGGRPFFRPRPGTSPRRRGGGRRSGRKRRGQLRRSGARRRSGDCRPGNAPPPRRR